MIGGASGSGAGRQRGKRRDWMAWVVLGLEGGRNYEASGVLLMTLCGWLRNVMFASSSCPM
jgi:hypothetical protein